MTTDQKKEIRQEVKRRRAEALPETLHENSLKMEPKKSCPLCKEEEGLMLMPGVAFDEHCHRVGYGGGYYDRYLEKHPGLVHIALAFEFQVFPEVPFEAHDILPQMIVTETRMIRPEGK